MFLRGCPDRGLGETRSHGVLSLPLVPFVVGWARQRVYALETRCRADHGGFRTRRHVPEDAGEPAQYCKRCGGHLMTNHPPLRLVDVFAATLPTLKFRPGVHINYAETVLPVRDGLPKLKDFPAQFGGSGEQLAE